MKSYLIDTQSILSVSAQSFKYDWNRSVKCLVNLGTVLEKVRVGHQVLACSQHPPLATLHSSLSTIHFSHRRAAVPYDKAAYKGRNWGVPDKPVWFSFSFTALTYY